MPENPLAGDDVAADAGGARDSMRHTLLVALAVSLVCSVLVSSAAVLLAPRQERNEALNRQRNILDVVGLVEPGRSIEELFARFEPRVVELATGRYTDALPPDFDALEAARDPGLGVDVPPAQDLANIDRRARYATVYLVRDEGELQYIVLPIHGAGLWSTLYGFVALEADANRIAGITFYEHAETPGLGGEIDKPAWRSLWPGKLVYDETGAPAIEVVKGRVRADAANAAYQVDGLAGATLTGRAVTNVLHYWLGAQGFGPYLARVRDGDN